MGPYRFLNVCRCALSRYLTAPAEQDPRFSIPTTSFSFGLSAALLLGLTALLKVRQMQTHYRLCLLTCAKEAKALHL